ncbi:permease [Gloeothece citriformis]|uniref:permease n=1 Tax=Gloeothece citriformis TaxID=2546356 RepID=UPI00059B836A|nr:permease [Gloeothece citriformis]
MDQLYSAFTVFLSLLVEAIPFLLLGVVLSSTLLIFVNVDKLIKIMPKNPILGAIVGSCIGFLFPVCECGNVPVARRLLLEGMPTSVAIAFLLAAPTINPVVVWSTWVAFQDQPEIVIGRVVFSVTIAITIACVFSVQKDPRPLLQPLLAKRIYCLTSSPRQQGEPVSTPLATVPTLLQSGTYLLGQGGKPLRMDSTLTANVVMSKPNSKFKIFVENVVQETRELGGVLILGSAIAAGIQIFVPREIILSLGQDTITSILAMMLLAAIVSICSTVDSFFALSFAATFTSSSLLAFLVFGPMIDLKAMGLMLSIFKPRMLIYLFALTAQLTFILALGHSYLF